jgi:hypothetical protein
MIPSKQLAISSFNVLEPEPEEVSSVMSDVKLFTVVKKRGETCPSEVEEGEGGA